MTSSDRFPVPVMSAVKSNLTDWCFQNLSKRALNVLTVQASVSGRNSELSWVRCVRKPAADSRQSHSPKEQHNTYHIVAYCRHLANTNDLFVRWRRLVSIDLDRATRFFFLFFSR